jgi:hypothetical protein
MSVTRGLRILAGMLMSSLPVLAVAPAPPVSYRIEARLDAAKKIVSGNEILSWTNYAPDPVDRLPFHLYLNAFADYRSTFLRGSSSWWARGSHFDPREPGGCTVISLTIDEYGDLTNSMRFVQPDDGNPYDRTVMEVALPRPVKPGERLTIRIRFQSMLPRLVARSGWTGEFILGGQWFPKIGVLEPPGWRGATATRWNCHQYHKESEFYANFGDYDVSLTLPSRYQVGATGRCVESRTDPKAGTTTRRFRQANVHDFAWAADPRFLVVTDKFSGERDVPPEETRFWAGILGVPPSALRLPDVTLILLMSPQHRAQIPLHIRTLKEAIRGYGLMLGPYPYETVTLVDPPSGAEASGGMEYPTFFTGETHSLAEYWPFREIGFETVVTHEFGHNYWQGMVANNEFEEPWLDEGINSFCESVVNQLSSRPPDQPELWGTGGMGGPWYYRLGYLFSLPLHDPLDRWSWRYYPGQYSVNAYDRSVVTLWTLRHMMGRERFHRTLRAFFTRWRFDHPTTADFTAAFEQAGGSEAREYLRQAIGTTGALDVAVESVENSAPEAKTGLIRSWALLIRSGPVRLPAEVRFRFADGRIENRIWPPDDAWTRFDFTGQAPLVEVRVDPAWKVPLDSNLANNSWVREPRRDVLTAWRSAVQAGLQHLLQILAILS